LARTLGRAEIWAPSLWRPELVSAVVKDVETRKQIHVIKESLSRLAVERAAVYAGLTAGDDARERDHNLSILPVF
jgi:hypothetical protein